MKIKAFIFLFVFGSLVATFISFGKIATSLAPDFSVFYNAALDIVHGQNPYLDAKLFTGVVYPPISLLFFLPLTWLPYSTAQLIWLGLSFLALLGGIYLSCIICFGNFSWRLFLSFLAFSLLAFPTKFTFGMGQSNLVAFFLLLLAFCFWQNKKQILAGLLLSIVCLLKPIFVFFLLFFLFKKSWLTIFTASITVIILFLGSFLIIKPELYIFYIKKIMPVLLNPLGREVYYNQGFMGFVSRHVSDLSLRTGLNFLLSLILLIITFLAIRKSVRSKEEFAVFFPTLLLIDTLSWQHHFVWLIFPFLVVFKYLIKIENVWPKILLFLSYVLVAINFKEPIFFLSHVFWGTLILWTLNIYILKKSYGDP